MDGAPIEDLDGSPMVDSESRPIIPNEDIDGAAIEDLDGVPVSDDLDGTLSKFKPVMWVTGVVRRVKKVRYWNLFR